LSESPIQIGDVVPDFTLPDQDGQPASLADLLRAGCLVLYFYPKDDTTGCTMEAQQFTALAPEFEKAGATVIGVSKDSVKSHEKFAGKYGLGVDLGSDPDGQVVERYGSWVEKSLYGRHYMGIDRSTFLIKDGVIRRIWRKVKVAGHAQAVLDAVKAT